jgi:hypothetical protein
MVGFQGKGRAIAASICIFPFAMTPPAMAQKDTIFEGKTAVAGTILTAFQMRVLIAPNQAFFASYVVVDLRKFKVGIAVPERNIGGASLQRLFVDNRALAIVNGSFLESFTPALPAGLLLYRGKLISDWKKNDPVLTGVICFSSSKPAMVDIMNLEDGRRQGPRYKDCLQVGPLLSLNGEDVADLAGIDANAKSRNYASKMVERSFLGKVGRNRLIFGVTSPTSLDALLQFGIRPERDGGLGLTDLIGLSSRGTAGLIVGGQENLIAGSTSVLLPSAIMVVD